MRRGVASWGTLGALFDQAESRVVELKQFSLNGDLLCMRYAPDANDYLLTALHHTDADARAFLESPRPDGDRMLLDVLDHLVLPSLELTLQWIMPKYVSCFCNAGERGELYIGIADDHEITGVPMVAGLTPGYLARRLDECCAELVFPESEELRPRAMLSAEILPLDAAAEDLRDGMADAAQAFCRERLAYNEAVHAYVRDYHAWKATHAVLSGKLINIVNTPSLRQELLAFIDSRREVWTADTQLLVDYLGAAQYVHFDTAYESFEPVRHDPSRIWYWVTRFKETRLSKLPAAKPSKPKFCPSLPVTTAAAKLSPLRKRLVSLGVKYSVIRVVIDGRRSRGVQVAFAYPNSPVLHKKLRCVDGAGEPYSGTL